MNTVHTTTTAAQAAGVSRTTVSRALKNGELLGQRGNDGKWKIRQDDLDEWLAARSELVRTAHARTHSEHNEQSTALLNQLGETRERLAAAEAENTLLRERIDDLKTERDAWKDQARPWWQRLRS